jgi:hypothetical protein
MAPPDNSDPPGFLPPSGNYRDLLSFRKAETIYDFTFRFTEKCFRLGDRTVDQMVQSARSGKQNIAECGKASTTSSEIELKLVNVARASLEELLLDDQDYLRVRDHTLWDKTAKRPFTFARWGVRRMSPMKPIVPLWRPGRRRRPPILPSA